MSESPFKPGDRVQLKSGGPVMTVEKSAVYSGELQVKCVYFEGAKKYEEFFGPAMLKAL